MAYLTEDTKISQAWDVTDGASAATDITGATLDMAGWDGVLCIVSFGAITAGGAQSIKGQQGADSGLSDAADLKDSKVTVADSDDDKTFYLDFQNLDERYFRCICSRATQVSTVGSGIYIQYRGRSPLASHGAGVSGEKHNRPAEGTA